MSTKVNVSALAALLLQLSTQGVELVDDTVSISASSAVVVEEESARTLDPVSVVQNVNDEVSPELESDAPKVVGITSVGEEIGGSEEKSGAGANEEQFEDVPVDQGCGVAEPLVAVGASPKLKKKEKNDVAVPLSAGSAKVTTYAEAVGVGTGSSTSSWADEVEEEERRVALEAEKVVVPAVPGGVAQVESVSFFKEYVRVPRVKELRRILKNICGVELARPALQELALASVTAAAMPPAFVDGRNRLSALARVGDAAMLLVLLTSMYKMGAPASSLQAAREARLSNYKMQTQFSACALAKYIDGATPATLKVTRTGADACEAIAGVLQMHLGSGAVERYMRWLGL